MDLSIDVLIITYNQESYIVDCLESILCQECQVPFRILVSDDCSTDNTAAILSEYKAKYPEQVVILKNKNNLGVSRNFEKVIRESSAPLIAFCEGDDFWCDSLKLQKQLVAFQQESSPSFVYSDFHRCNSLHGKLYLFRDSAQSVADPPVSGLIFNKLLERVNIHLSTILCQRRLAVEFLDSSFFNRDCQLADVPLILFLAASGHAVGINESLSVYRQNQGSITNVSLVSKLRIQIEHLNYLQQYNQYFNKTTSPGHLRFANQLAAISSSAYQDRRPLLFIRFQPKFSLKFLLRLMLIFLPPLHRVYLARVHQIQLEGLIDLSVPISIVHNPFRLKILV